MDSYSENKQVFNNKNLNNTEKNETNNSKNYYSCPFKCQSLKKFQNKEQIKDHVIHSCTKGSFFFKLFDLCETSPEVLVKIEDKEFHCKECKIFSIKNSKQNKQEENLNEDSLSIISMLVKNSKLETNKEKLNKINKKQIPTKRIIGGFENNNYYRNIEGINAMQSSKNEEIQSFKNSYYNYDLEKTINFNSSRNHDDVMLINETSLINLFGIENKFIKKGEKDNNENNTESKIMIKPEATLKGELFNYKENLPKIKEDPEENQNNLSESESTKKKLHTAEIKPDYENVVESTKVKNEKERIVNNHPKNEKNFSKKLNENKIDNIQTRNDLTKDKLKSNNEEKSSLNGGKNDDSKSHNSNKDIILKNVPLKETDLIKLNHPNDNFSNYKNNIKSNFSENIEINKKIKFCDKMNSENPKSTIANSVAQSEQEEDEFEELFMNNKKKSQKRKVVIENNVIKEKQKLNKNPKNDLDNSMDRFINDINLEDKNLNKKSLDISDFSDKNNDNDNNHVDQEIKKNDYSSKKNVDLNESMIQTKNNKKRDNLHLSSKQQNNLDQSLMNQIDMENSIFLNNSSKKNKTINKSEISIDDDYYNNKKNNRKDKNKSNSNLNKNILKTNELKEQQYYNTNNYGSMNDSMVVDIRPQHQIGKKSDNYKNIKNTNYDYYNQSCYNAASKVFDNSMIYENINRNIYSQIANGDPLYKFYCSNADESTIALKNAKMSNISYKNQKSHYRQNFEKNLRLVMPRNNLNLNDTMIGGCQLEDQNINYENIYYPDQNNYNYSQNNNLDNSMQKINTNHKSKKLTSYEYYNYSGSNENSILSIKNTIGNTKKKYENNKKIQELENEDEDSDNIFDFDQDFYEEEKKKIKPKIYQASNDYSNIFNANKSKSNFMKNCQVNDTMCEFDYKEENYNKKLNNEDQRIFKQGNNNSICNETSIIEFDKTQTIKESKPKKINNCNESILDCSILFDKNKKSKDKIIQKEEIKKEKKTNILKGNSVNSIKTVSDFNKKKFIEDKIPKINKVYKDKNANKIYTDKTSSERSSNDNEENYEVYFRNLKKDSKKKTLDESNNNNRKEVKNESNTNKNSSISNNKNNDKLLIKENIENGIKGQNHSETEENVNLSNGILTTNPVNIKDD